MSFRNFLLGATVALLPSGFALAQTVTTLVNQPPPDGVIYGFLMTDGRVLYQGGNITDWYIFTPDAYGSYQNGTWSAAASLPPSYGPYATGGQVLPDGRLLLVGGEYLLNAAQTDLVFTLTTKSALYDPRTNAWTMVKPPPGWIAIGDSPGAVLADGLYILGEKVTRQMALFDPQTNAWVEIGSIGKRDVNAEEGWTLLPDGSLLTADVTAAPNSERYVSDPDDPLLGRWVDAGDTVQNLKFTWTGENAKPIKYGHNHYYTPAGEIGPAILRPDGTVFATGAINKGAVAGHTAIYHPQRGQMGTWTAGPDFQKGDDAGDEFAVLLPNGNVLVEANTDGSDVADVRAKRVARLIQSHKPTAARVKLRQAAPAVAPQQATNPCAPFPVQTYHLYEFDGSTFALEPVDVTTCGNSLSLLVLPTGETIVGGVGLYTSATGNPAPDWAPVVFRSPHAIAPGGTYAISGKQFNGLSQANAYGDEFPAPTNYPLVRITNDVTGHVFYARTHDHSSMGVATGRLLVATKFDVPDTIEPGASILEVVANGIASRPVDVIVEENISRR
jgi:hypothetical protein